MAGIIPRLPVADFQRDVLADIVRARAIVQRGGIDHRLEGRAGLALCHGRAIEFGGGIVHPADHGDDPAILAHGDGGGLAGAEIGALFRDGCGDQFLHLRLQFGLNRQGDHKVRRSIFRQQILHLLDSRIKDIAELRAFRCALHQRDFFLPGKIGLQDIDEAGIGHFAKHIGLTHAGLIEIAGESQPTWRLWQGGEQGGFAEGQLGRGLAEIMRAGRVEAIEAGAEIDPVKIKLEDLVLRQALFQLAGKPYFLGLAADGLARVEHKVLDQLLGDGRGTRHRAPGAPVHPGRADNGGRIGAVMFVKALVLGGDEGLRHMRGQVGHAHDAAIARSANGEQRAVHGAEFHSRVALDGPQLSRARQLGHVGIKRVVVPPACPPEAEQADQEGDKAIFDGLALPGGGLFYLADDGASGRAGRLGLGRCLGAGLMAFLDRLFRRWLFRLGCS